MCVKIPQCGYMEHGLKDIVFYVQKHITPCTVVITSLLVRDKPPGSPASVKRVYWLIAPIRALSAVPWPEWDQLRTQLLMIKVLSEESWADGMFSLWINSSRQCKLIRNHCWHVEEHTSKPSHQLYCSHGRQYMRWGWQATSSLVMVRAGGIMTEMVLICNIVPKAVVSKYCQND